MDLGKRRGVFLDSDRFTSHLFPSSFFLCTLSLRRPRLTLNPSSPSSVLLNDLNLGYLTGTVLPKTVVIPSGKVEKGKRKGSTRRFVVRIRPNCL